MMARQHSLADGIIGVRLDQRERLLIAAPLGIVAAVAMAFSMPWHVGGARRMGCRCHLRRRVSVDVRRRARRNRHAARASNT